MAREPLQRRQPMCSSPASKGSRHLFTSMDGTSLGSLATQTAPNHASDSQYESQDSVGSYLDQPRWTLVTSHSSYGSLKPLVFEMKASRYPKLRFNSDVVSSTLTCRDLYRVECHYHWPCPSAFRSHIYRPSVLSAPLCPSCHDGPGRIIRRNGPHLRGWGCSSRDTSTASPLASGMEALYFYHPPMALPQRPTGVSLLDSRSW